MSAAKSHTGAKMQYVFVSIVKEKELEALGGGRRGAADIRTGGASAIFAIMIGAPTEVQFRPSATVIWVRPSKALALIVPTPIGRMKSGAVKTGFATGYQPVADGRLDLCMA